MTRQMWVKRGYPKLPGRPTRKDLNEYQNFLKHADKDPEGTLEFFPIMVEPMLADACRTYIELTAANSPLFEVMSRWFNCHGGRERFEKWPKEKEELKEELLALFATGDRLAFFQKCASA